MLISSETIWRSDPSAGLSVSTATLDLDALHSELSYGPLYAVLDSARNRGVQWALCEPGVSYWNLYDGKRADELLEVSPFLVDLRNNSTLLHTLTESGWGDYWGIYLHSDASPDQILAHLRKFILVQIEGGEEVYFRFYDPRVLRPFLRIVDEQQWREFFGTVIQRFYCEGESPSTAYRFDAPQITGQRSRTR